MKRKIRLIIPAAVAVLALVWWLTRQGSRIVLTGMVTTDDVIVSAEIQGRLRQLLVKQGDAVSKGQLLAEIQPAEWRADMAFYENSERQSSAQVAQAEAELRYQQAQTDLQIRQAEANLASVESQGRQAEADCEIARLNFGRSEELFAKGTESEQARDEARTTRDGAEARLQGLREQAKAARAAVAMARAGAEQVAARRAALAAGVHQLDAVAAEKEKAKVRLGYTEIRAPIDGVVDVRAALEGEVVAPGQAIVTLINPDDLWVRVDVEEGYIDRIRLGDRIAVRLPSEAAREGVVFFRGIDADYATQRDVSRTKRDIKTFEVRLRCDNRDRALAVGMTAFATVPLDAR